MTLKQQRFCEFYVQYANGTKAAIEAGFTPKAASETASRLLTNATIRETIEKLQAARSEATGITTEWVINNLKDVAERCMQAQPVMRFDPVEKQMVQVTEIDENGQEVGVYEFDSSGANKALELIGKHLGTWERDNEQKKSTIIVEIE